MLAILVSGGVVAVVLLVAREDDDEFARAPEERVALEAEWRHARRLALDGITTISLRPIPDARALRLGLMPTRSGDAGLRVRAYAGDQLLGEWKPANEGWNDYRVDLAQASPRADTYRVEFDGDTDVWVSHCELVGENDDKPNVLLVMIDTLRMGRLGCYGYERPTSPHMDALAQDGIRLTHLVPSSSWTRPSVASLLTGLYPSGHGAVDRYDLLRPDLPSLADALSENGWASLGIASNPNIAPLWGFGSGFGRYVYLDFMEHQSAIDEEVSDIATDALRDLAGRPWFIYAHFMGPHGPYEPPEPYRAAFKSREYDDSKPVSRFMRMRDLYDAEIANTDAQVGRIVEELKRLEIYDNTLIVLLSDHGEAFFEHGVLGHGRSLYEEEMRVPFLVKLPGGTVTDITREQLVEIIDVAPTILDLLGLPPEARFQGESAKGVLLKDAQHRHAAFASLHLGSKNLAMARSAATKYIRDYGRGEAEWFDLEADPKEKQPAREPIEGQTALAQLVDTLGTRAIDGLHLEFVRDVDGTEPYVLEGRLITSGHGPVSLRYPHREHSIESSDNTITFRAVLQSFPDEVQAIMPEADLRNDRARMRVAMEPDATLTLELKVNGIPAAESGMDIVGGKLPALLRGEQIQASSLDSTRPNTPGSHSAPLAISGWYVSPNRALDGEDVPEDVRDSLEALGYLE